jgi:integrase
MKEFRFGVRQLPPVPKAIFQVRKKDGQRFQVLQVDYWDKALPGFGMRVSNAGTRTWVVMYRYNARKRRMKLGNYPAVSLAAARDMAREVMRKSEKGDDPASERKVKRAPMTTVEQLAKLYIEEYAKQHKRSWLKDEQILNREVLPKIGRKRVKDLTRQDVRDVLQPIIDRGALIRANHTLEVVRRMLNWAIADKDLPMTNPAAGISKPGEVKDRNRYLRVDELKLFWGALKTELLGTAGVGAFKFLLLTAQREMEVLRMRWEDIDWNDMLWTVPADHAKNELEHVVPLSPLAIDQLTALAFFRSMERGEPMMADADRTKAARGMTGYVFPSPVKEGEHVRRVFIEKRIKKVREASGIEDITIHDLRRTVTTYFGKVKVPQEIKKKILNHAKRKKSDVTEIYDRFEYVQEKRDALLKWEKLLLRVVGEEFDTDGYAAALFRDDETNVIPLERARA